MTVGGRREWPGGWRAGCGGGGGRVYPGWRKQPGLPGFWIPAYAGMTAGRQISPTPNRHLRLYPVIPAKAGIHPRPSLTLYPATFAGRPHRHSGAGRNPEPRWTPADDWAGVWIPAFAGMTVGATGMAGRMAGRVWRWRRPGISGLAQATGLAGVLDSGLRRNDGGEANFPNPQPSSTPLPRHSRESGNPPPAITHLVPCHIRRSPPPSFRRRPESRTPADAGRRLGRVWIPAFAGMTVGGGGFRRGLADDPPFILRQAQDERLPTPPGWSAPMAGLAVGGVSPSPGPLPLGEGLWRRPAALNS